MKTSGINDAITEQVAITYTSSLASQSQNRPHHKEINTPIIRDT